MTQPVPFTRSADYTDDAAASAGGRSTISPTKLDAEFDALVTTIGQVLANLAIIQRDDTELNDGTVKIHALSSDVRALLAASGVTVKGAWLTTTAYVLKDIVTESGATYICAVAHTSGTFATDLAAAKWVLLANSPSAFAATSISVTPAGGIAASNAQAALEELDSEKLAKASNLSDVANPAAAIANIGGLPLAGGTMTGKIILDGAPTASLHPASKAYADDIINGLPTGQCVFQYTSATQCTLSPRNGNKLFIEGEWYTIPDLGVQLSNGGLSANTVYNVYAYISSGNITLEASADARTRDATYGHQIRTGYPSRTLVGKVRTNASSQFVDIAYGSAAPGATIGVLSWYNKRKKSARVISGSIYSTGSAPWVEVNSAMRINFISWADEATLMSLTSSVYQSLASNLCYLGIGLDSTSGVVAQSAISSHPTVGALLAMACATSYAPAEGYHYATPLHGVGGGTMTNNSGYLQLSVEVMG